MRANGISLFVGLIVTIFLCLIWSVIIGSNDPMYLWPGFLAVIGIMFIAGFKNIPIQHTAVLKIFGKRWNTIFYEGWCWIPWFMASVEVVSVKDIVVDIPPIKVITKDRVEVVFDIWVWLRVKDPITFLNLENPLETIKTSTISKGNEASWEFGGSHTYNQCLGGKEEIQNEIKMKMSIEKDKLGVEVTNIDIRPPLPTDEIRKELSEDKRKEIKVKRFKKSLAQIKKGAPGITDDTLVNTTQVVEGTVKKEIKEEKKTIKLDVESDILRLVTEFLSKKKSPSTNSGQGDKK